MIIGRGLLANAFEPYLGSNPDIIVFASGVSNSRETRISEFEREQALLSQLLENEDRRLIYFGSCGIVAPQAELTPYMQHKRSMESLVLSTSTGLVFRLPQVVGKTDNPHTLTNFLRNRIVSGEHFPVWRLAERNLIDIDDIVRIVSTLAFELPAGSTAISIAALRSLSMPEIIRIFELVLGKTANCTYMDQGSPMTIDISIIQYLSDRLGICLGGDYAERIIDKYYAIDRKRQANHLIQKSAKPNIPTDHEQQLLDSPL